MYVQLSEVIGCALIAVGVIVVTVLNGDRFMGQRVEGLEGLNFFLLLYNIVCIAHMYTNKNHICKVPNVRLVSQQ